MLDIRVADEQLAQGMVSALVGGELIKCLRGLALAKEFLRAGENLGEFLGHLAGFILSPDRAGRGQA